MHTGVAGVCTGVQQNLYCDMYFETCIDYEFQLRFSPAFFNYFYMYTHLHIVHMCQIHSTWLNTFNHQCTLFHCDHHYVTPSLPYKDCM